VPIWKGLLSPLTLNDISDDKLWEQYKAESDTGKVSKLWEATARSVWATLKGVGLKRGQDTLVTYFNVLTKEDFEAIEEVSEIFREKPQFFGAHGTEAWNTLLAAYVNKITDVLTECIGSKQSEQAGFTTVKTSLGRKLEWVFYRHCDSTTRTIMLPLATPKLLESLCISLGQISNAVQEVSYLLQLHNDINRFICLSNSLRCGSTRSFYDTLEALKHLNCRRML
jgi:hypothetical protein